MSAMIPTPAIARSTGLDAGNRSMLAAGRTAWNEDDWAAACAVTDQLRALCGSAPTNPAKVKTAKPSKPIGYDTFAPALMSAREGAARAHGTNWHLVVGAGILAHIPSKLTSFSVKGRTVHGPTAMRLPAPKFWPGGVWPVSVVAEVDGPRDTRPAIPEWLHPARLWRSKLEPIAKLPTKFAGCSSLPRAYFADAAD